MVDLARSFDTGVRIGQNIRDRREQTRLRAENRAIELSNRGVSFDEGQLNVIPGGATDIQQKQNKITNQLVTSLQGRLDAQVTDNALLDFANTGNADFLNKALTKNPSLASAWAKRGVQQVSNIDFDNDKGLLGSIGITESMLDTPEKKAVFRKNLFKVFDGKNWQIGSLNKTVQETGALPRLGARSDIFITNLGEMRELVKTDIERSKAIEEEIVESRALRARGATGVGPAEVKAITESKQLLSSAKVREIAERLGIDQVKLEIELGELGLFKRKVDIAEFEAVTGRLKLDVDAAKNRIGKLTKEERNLNSAEQAEIDLSKLFGGVDQYFNTDFRNKDNVLKAEPLIRRIEILGKAKLSNEDERDMKSISQLLAVGGKATELTDDETGILDNVLSKIKLFTTDNVKGAEGRAAYASYRNLIRNALFGKALTSREIESFNESFGTLGQQLGPVLEQFKVNLQTILGKLTAIGRNNNTWVSHFRLGVPKDQLSKIIESLNERVTLLNKRGENIQNRKKAKSRRAVKNIISSPPPAEQPSTADIKELPVDFEGIPGA